MSGSVISMEENKSYVRVPEFYAGKSVFVTGGSGFLGKVIIEKLLYSCPLVERVYVLLRDKKNVSAEQRLKDMIHLPVFSRLKAEKPDMLKKLVLVEGDLADNNLNMSTENLAIVREKVSIVIHSAATVKFNEPLTIALKINVEGTRNVLKFCKTLKKIDAFVYVSTAYSNAGRSVVEEVIYPPPASIEDAYKIAEQAPGDENITVFLNGWPNTYTYTKALAENLVLEMHGDIPTVIVRPSIVTGSAYEPAPGWVDNWFGPTGIMTPLALGVCRTLYSEYDYNIDLIPVDYVCNMILVAATRAKRSREILLYNSCSGTTNPISIGNAVKLFTYAGMRDGFNLLPFPQLVLYTKRRWLSKMVVAVMYTFANMVDIILKIVRKKPRFVEIHTKAVLYQEAIAFFTSNSWLMQSPKALALAKSLSPKEYEQFPCNPQDIVWEEHMSKYYHGIKKYLLGKENPIL